MLVVTRKLVLAEVDPHISFLAWISTGLCLLAAGCCMFQLVSRPGHGTMYTTPGLASTVLLILEASIGSLVAKTAASTLANLCPTLVKKVFCLYF